MPSNAIVVLFAHTEFCWFSALCAVAGHQVLPFRPEDQKKWVMTGELRAQLCPRFTCLKYNNPVNFSFLPPVCTLCTLSAGLSLLLCESSHKL